MQFAVNCSFSDDLSWLPHFDFFGIEYHRISDSVRPDSFQYELRLFISLFFVYRLREEVDSTSGPAHYASALYVTFEHGVFHKFSFLSISPKAYAYDREVYAACLHFSPVYGWLIFGHVYPDLGNDVSLRRYSAGIRLSFYPFQIVCIFGTASRSSASYCCPSTSTNW